MKPTPLSALLADDLLLDRVGARLDTDDDLGSLLLAVAHHADTPIPRAEPARRRRPHRGLTVIAALGVAVSGATVAAAVEMAPVGPDQASGVPHLRGGLSRSMQALVRPFLAGTPFHGRLVLPFGGTPTGPFTATFTAEGLPGASDASVYPMGDPIVGASTLSQDLQGLSPETTQGKGTPNGGTTLTDSVTDQGNQDNQDNQGSEPAVPASQPKSTPTPTPTPAPATATTTNNGVTGVANGQDNGQGDSQGNGQGNSHSPGQGGSGGSSVGTATTVPGTTGTTTSGTITDDDDPASRVPEKRKATIKAAPQPAVTGVAPTSMTGSTGAAGTTGTAATTGTTGTTGTTTGSAATAPAGP